MEQKTIRFGGYDWIVLEERQDRLLLLAKEISELRPFDTDFDDEIWESCELRRYLNGEFLQRFSAAAQERILSVTLPNRRNPWFDTPGGDDTEDQVFLLSIEEAVAYFGGTLGDKSSALDIDGGRFVPVENGTGGFFSDDGDALRQADYRGAPVYWWLRSPGVHHSTAAVVCDNGGIGVLGFDLMTVLDVGGVGVRPAMWIKK